MYEKYLTLGIRITANLPEKVTNERVYIYNGDAATVTRLEKVIKAFPKL